MPVQDPRFKLNFTPKRYDAVELPKPDLAKSVEPAARLEFEPPADPVVIPKPPPRNARPVAAPTADLRFIKVKNMKVLQQKWLVGRDEDWRDVPLVKKESNEAGQG